MTGYLHRFQHDTFQGVLWWAQLDTLWDAVRRDAGRGWFPYTLGEAPPTRPAGAVEVEAFVEAVDATLRKLHSHDHCGLVYADDREAPGFVIVYHPHRLGGCGALRAPLPGWTLTLEPPVDLPAALDPPRHPWWRHVFGG